MPVLRYVCIILVLMVLADTARATDHFVLGINGGMEVSAGATFTVSAIMYYDTSNNRINFDGDKYLTWTSTPYATATLPQGTVTFTSGATSSISGFVLYNASEKATITVKSTDGMAGTLSSITVNAGIPSCFNVMIKDNGTKTAGVGFGVDLEMMDAYGNLNNDPSWAATYSI
ncbi:hypothetical protein COZ13_09740, partial [Candidatus Desantisbacteria bacterium CG_4_10_14_3_um_filter_40_18]